jgi:hypothetical protein
MKLRCLKMVMSYDTRDDEMMVVSIADKTRLVWVANELYIESIQDESQRIPDLDLEHRDDRWEVGRYGSGCCS